MIHAIQRLQGRASMRARDEAGFTMVEMVMAIFIFGMVVTGVAVGMGSGLNLTRQNRNRSVAANLAAQQMDTVRSTDFTTLDGQTQVTQPTTVSSPSVEGVTYTISQNIRWVYKNATGATAGPCQSPPNSSNPLAYIAVTETVTWPDMHGVSPVQSDTVISPPVGVYDQTEGHIRVTVLNAAGSPVSGATVEIVNASQGVDDTDTTGSDGCSFFAYRPVGAYTVTLSSVSGKVDGQGSTTPTTTATVKSGSTSSVQFMFDTAASLALTLSPNVATYTVPTTVPVTIANTALTPSGTKPFTSPTGSPRTLTNLFPYSSGYQAWAGTCSDADPQGVGPSGAYYSGATRPAAIAVPGSGTVTLPTTKLQFKRSSGSAAYLITATHKTATGWTSDTGCATAETYTLAAAQTISTTTVALNFALPYGSWTIAWRNNSTSVTGSQVVSLSPLNATWPVTPVVTTVT
jgi:prepilin-type N-terminal cleavage/methylation domain-containing protein